MWLRGGKGDDCGLDENREGDGFNRKDATLVVCKKPVTGRDSPLKPSWSTLPSKSHPWPQRAPPRSSTPRPTATWRRTRRALTWSSPTTAASKLVRPAPSPGRLTRPRAARRALRPAARRPGAISPRDISGSRWDTARR